MKDFFISYNSHDCKRAEWIAFQLEEAGYSTIIQAWDFRPGRSFPRLMLQGLEESTQVMAVWSQHYLDALYTHPEWEAAFLTDPTGSDGGLILVRVSECKVPKMLRRLIYIDLVDIAEEEAKKRLLDGIHEGRLKPDCPPPFTATEVKAPPAEPRRIFHVPFSRNTFFTGREEVLEELHRRLRSEGEAALSQVEAISGLGGIGKTQTALEYAYRHRDEYQAVLWAKAESEESLTSAYAEIADVLDLALKDAKEQALAVAAVKHWLGEHPYWLLVLDNADHPELVKGFLPIDHKGSVLVTSRAGVFDSLGIAKPVRMWKMPEDEAKQFLYKRTGRTAAEEYEAEAVRELAKELGFLPLALEQAAAYIFELRCPFQRYLVSYRTRGVELLNQRRPVAGDYPESVQTTWSMNIEQVAQQSEASVEILKLSAFLAPDEIPFELLAKGAKQIGPAFSAKISEEDPLSVEEVLQPLSQYSLIQRQPASDSYSILRMVQAVVRAAMGEEERKVWATRTLLSVGQAFPNTEFESWQLCERLTPHAQSCLELVEELGLEMVEAGRLFNQLGAYLLDRGRYDPSQLALERALEIREKLLDSDHPDVAQSLSNLARLYKSKGDYSGPLPLYQRALAIREKSLGSKHPDTAQSLNNLAELYVAQADYSSALPLHERALEIRQKVLDPDHPDVAESLHNLAFLFKSEGDNRRARPLYEQAAEIWEKALDPKHPLVAQSLHNLAHLLKSQGEYSRAQPLYEQALATWEKALGPMHPYVASVLNNLAKLHLDQGNYDRAKPLLERVVAIDEKTLSPEHPNVAAGLSNLAKFYRSQGDCNQALPLYKRAIEIFEKARPGHPDLATGLENYAAILEEMGSQEEAKVLKSRAKRIRAEHARKNPKPTTEVSQRNTGGLPS